jgi:dTDP-4-dehydrorhamnose 3,5-epimerase
MGDAAATGTNGQPAVEVTEPPVKDPQTVTAEGAPVAALIDGVRVRPARTIPDERGALCEIYNPAWGFTEEPLVYVYQSSIRPGRTKGWVVHYEQDDRLFFSGGMAKVVLYDARTESPTHEMVNEFCFGAEYRALLRIPRGVFHAIKNVGQTDCLFVNMPTRPYRHENPDKYRLPLDTDAIPYRFA